MVLTLTQTWRLNRRYSRLGAFRIFAVLDDNNLVVLDNLVVSLFRDELALVRAFEMLFGGVHFQVNREHLVKLKLIVEVLDQLGLDGVAVYNGLANFHLQDSTVVLAPDHCRGLGIGQALGRRNRHG